MRTSNYCIYVKLSGFTDCLLIHGYTGAVDIVQSNVVDFLKNDGRDNGFMKVSDDTKKILKDRGYLTEKKVEDERARVSDIARLIHSRQLQNGPAFLLIPTYDCNLRCSYCYESKISRGSSGWTKELMTQELVDAAFAAMQKLEPEVGRSRNITLYGGEPLLARNYFSLRTILEKGCERGYTFGAITNGYELEFYRQFIGKGKLQFLQITIDGSELTHDARRPLTTGAGSFQKIVSNISMSIEMGATVSLRVNVDATNVDDLEKTAVLIEEKGWNKCESFRCHVAPVHLSAMTPSSRQGSTSAPDPLVDACRTSPSLLSKSRVSEYLRTLGQRNSLVSVFDEPDSYLKQQIKNVLKSQGGFQFRPSFCGANSSTVIFDPRGDIYTCMEFVGERAQRVGTFFPELNIDNEQSRLWRERTIASLKSCSMCKYSLFCGGGCAAFAKRSLGSLEQSYCDEFPRMFHHNARSAYQEWVAEDNGNTFGAQKGSETVQEVR